MDAIRKTNSRYALRAGAAGYLTKESIPEELVQAIRKIMGGGKYIRPSVADLLATQLQQGDANQPPHTKLSDREFPQSSGLDCSRKNVTNIAEELSLSVKSVSTYRQPVLWKNFISNRPQTSPVRRSNIV